MKASPPPPPEPPPAAAPPAAAPVTPAVPAADPAPGGPWPAWFGTLDLAAVLFVVVAAFLGASFAARNSDLWRNLAAGQRLVQGTYSLGSDPFSYTGADRTWVNPSWLYDAAAYGLFSADPAGGWIVGLKALAFAGAFGLPMLVRRSEAGLWPWALAAALGVMAALPMAAARPAVLSMLFLAVTLVAVYCCPWSPTGWAKPVGLAVLFAVWANTDALAVLGPLTLVLVLVGEVLDRRLLAAPDPAADDPFPVAPPAAGLAKALGLGAVACLLNPSFLVALTKDPTEAVTQLVPSDLGWTLPTELRYDPELRNLLLSPLGKDYSGSASLGYNLNGLAGLLLAGLGATALAAGYARLRAAHILLWVGFAALALTNYRLVPFFAVVAAPLTAGYLNRLAGRVVPRGDGAAVLVTLAGVGRGLLLAATMAMTLAAYPGWLHTNRANLTDPALAYRVEWAVRADEGLATAAKTLQSWRADGSLPADVRGLHTALELANYAAWFAPGEKVFADGRYAFHRHELPALVGVRRALAEGRTEATAGPAAVRTREAVDRTGAGYLALGSSGRRIDLDTVGSLIDDARHWTLWHLDGRSAVVGRAGLGASDGLRFDPVRLAFGPQVTPLPAAKLVPPPPAEVGFLDRYVARPDPAPAGADDAVVYSAYAEGLDRRRQAEQRVRNAARASVAGVAAAAAGPDVPRAGDEAQVALPMLAVRAARRAITAAPDRADGYLALAEAYRHPLSPAPDAGLRQLQMLTAMARSLARMPAPAEATPGAALTAMQRSLQLADLFKQTQQYDLSRDAVQRAIAYATALSESAEGQAYLAQLLPPDPKRTESPAATVLKGLEQVEGEVTEVVQRQTDQLAGRPRKTAAERIQAAFAAGLPGQAVKLAEGAVAELAGKPEELPVRLAVAQAKLRAGRLEDAVADLSAIRERVKDVGPNAAPDGPEATVRAQLPELLVVVNQLVGDFADAGALLREQFAWLPQLPPDVARRAVVFPYGRDPGLLAVAGVPALLPYLGEAQQLDQVRQLLTTQADRYLFARGLLALTAGDVAEAGKWFDQALKPQGIPLAELGGPTRQREIELYQRLIREAARSERRRTPD